MASPGPTTRQYTQELAANIVRLGRVRRGLTQRQLAEAAGVPTSTVARIESGARQPSLVTLSRLLAAADLELRVGVEPYDDHDDVLDARRAALSEGERREADATYERVSATLAGARRLPRGDGQLTGGGPARPAAAAR